ncbi:MAG: c-type cytochrome [Verrucomicrobia bacterium]|nr:c-type cytochrome [Verrucomicrobiota bacterium]
MISNPILPILLALSIPLAARPAEPLSVGASRVDITPTEPIRLTGYAVRQKPAEGVDQPLWAKALAIRSEKGEISILVTVDNCGVPAPMTEEVAARLRGSHGIPRERFTICSSHTHSGPLVNGFAPNIFAQDIAADDQAAIDRYSARLVDEIEKAAKEAIAKLKRGHLRWGQGQAGFAANRRTPGGPVDHSVQVLEAREENGGTIAILANYACHCTTLGGEFNRHHGDWAGHAQEAIEKDFPGTIALVAIGCGADANPNPRGGTDHGLAHALAHGRALAREASRVLASAAKPLTQAPQGVFRSIRLPYQKHFSQAEWESRAERPGIVGYHARKHLARLKRGETLPDSLEYPVQAWTFGHELAMVFLGGEVVVDYAIGLKDALDGRRLWINAYANDVPCYIPSRRILAEGGYEAEDSLWYYDRPARLAPATESLILQTVQSILPAAYANPQPTNALTPPRSVSEALSTFTLHSNLAIECVAAEPLVVDPVAIDFGPDRRLWVVEMRDYPSGLHNQGAPGGRVRFLRDRDGDGRFDDAHTFLESLPFPTGLMVWRDGVLIGAAPDVLFARDTDGDGKADDVKKLFSGFATHNFQARVNGFAAGLDGWIHGSSGLFGGSVTNWMMASHPVVECRNRDFLWNPVSGELRAGAGVSQQGRVRDDFGNWFGNDNSTLLWHYPFTSTQLTRNPHQQPPRDRVNVAARENLHQLFPTSQTLARFNDFHHANRVTSACGPGLYRDDLLGPEFQGNAFICEPVHNLVRRLRLESEGITFRAGKAPEESEREFLSSTDHWFRPVQARTGPDGALWIVDMYRQVIEHPRWIPPDRLARADVRAGDDRGRIYRVRPRSGPLRPVPNFLTLTPQGLAEALDSPNGIVRDLVQQRLELGVQSASLHRRLRHLALRSEHPAVRIQALAMLNNAGKMNRILWRLGLNDPHPGVRYSTLSMAENRLAQGSQDLAFLLRDLVPSLHDKHPSVRFHAALALVATADQKVAGILAQRLAEAGPSDEILAAIPTALPSLTPRLFHSLLPLASASAGVQAALEAILPGVATVHSPEAHLAVLDQLLPSPPGHAEDWRWRCAADYLAAVSKQQAMRPETLRSWLTPVQAEARRLALDPASGLPRRLAAIRLLRFNRSESVAPAALEPLLHAEQPPELLSAVLETLGASADPAATRLLLDVFPRLTPAYRRQILEHALTRAESTKELLQRLRSRQLSIRELSAEHRGRLARMKDPELSAQARELLDTANSDESKTALIARYVQSKPALSVNHRRGPELFTLHCAPCHRYRGEGVEVGPDLETLTDRSRESLLTAILHPNSAIDDRFRAYEVATRDGRSLQGILSSETANGISLVQSGGVRLHLNRSEIARLDASGLSLMPEGFEQLLPPPDMEALIQFLRASTHSDGEKRARFVSAGSSPVRLLVHAERVTYRSWMGPLPMALCRLDPGRGKLSWTSTPLAATGERGSRRFRFAVAMGFLSQPPGSFTLMVNGHVAARFEVTLNNATWNSPDGRLQTRYAVQEITDQDSFGILTMDVVSDMIPDEGETHFMVEAQPVESQRWFGIYQVE